MDDIIHSKTVTRRMAQTDILELSEQLFLKELRDAQEIRSTEIAAKVRLRGSRMLWRDSRLSVNLP